MTLKQNKLKASVSSLSWPIITVTASGRRDGGTGGSEGGSAGALTPPSPSSGGMDESALRSDFWPQLKSKL